MLSKIDFVAVGAVLKILWAMTGPLFHAAPAPRHSPTSALPKSDLCNRVEF
jgi:hypothetical protein